VLTILAVQVDPEASAGEPAEDHARRGSSARGRPLQDVQGNSPPLLPAVAFPYFSILFMVHGTVDLFPSYRTFKPSSPTPASIHPSCLHIDLVSASVNPCLPLKA
jgi:hypothetical protein